MPDWRKPEDYVFTKTLEPYRWAWEFLRRNPEYRKDWSAALARFNSKTGEFEEISDIRAFVESGGSVVFAGERSSEDPTHPDFALLVDEADAWRLKGGLFNPATDEPTWLGFNHEWGVVSHLRSGSPFKARGPAYPIIEINLHLPLRPQLDAVVKPLERTRKHLKIKPRLPKHHRKLWPLYLRLLDAELDGRTPKQIADAFQFEIDGATEGKIWDQLKAAKKMTQPEGYLSIFLSTEK